MKLNDLLKQSQVGETVYESEKSTDEIISLYDQDYRMFSVSQRITNLLENISEDADAIKVINSVARNFKEIEEREMKIVAPTNVFYRMKLIPIVEGFNALVKKFEDKKYHLKIDKTKYAKMLATISFGIDHIAEEAGKEVYVKDVPLILEDTYETEKTLINEIVS
jgi:ABC-type uncharacterized transport system substrate-binding protein